MATSYLYLLGQLIWVLEIFSLYVAGFVVKCLCMQGELACGRNPDNGLGALTRIPVLR